MGTTNTSIWLKRIAVLTLLAFSTGSAVSAQTRQGAEPNFDPTLLHVTPDTGDDVRRLSMTEAAQSSARRPDPLWNGALIGAGVAIASGLFLCTRTEPWENCRDDVGPMLRIGAIGAGIGIGIDALIRGRKTPDDGTPAPTRLYAAPIVGRQTGGLQLSLSF